MHLDQSLKVLMDLTRQLCYNDLAEPFAFVIQPSGTDSHSGLNELEKKHLTVLKRQANKLLTADEVVEILCHDNKVPLWINTTIFESRPDLTVVHLLCSRRLRTCDQLYNRAVKYPPFHLLAPIPGYIAVQDAKEKFDINWKKQLNDDRKPRSVWSRLKQLVRPGNAG
jgi:hypothetical protein